jgi:hypothetical protein
MGVAGFAVDAPDRHLVFGPEPPGAARGDRYPAAFLSDLGVGN